jgi:hypothetical protein
LHHWLIDILTLVFPPAWIPGIPHIIHHPSSITHHPSPITHHPSPSSSPPYHPMSNDQCFLPPKRQPSHPHCCKQATGKGSHPCLLSYWPKLSHRRLLEDILWCPRDPLPSPWTTAI